MICAPEGNVAGGMVPLLQFAATVQFPLPVKVYVGGRFSPPMPNSENPIIPVLFNTGAVLEPVVVTWVPFKVQSPPAEGRLIRTSFVKSAMPAEPLAVKVPVYKPAVRPSPASINQDPWLDTEFTINVPSVKGVGLGNEGAVVDHLAVSVPPRSGCVVKFISAFLRNAPLPIGNWRDPVEADIQRLNGPTIWPAV